MSSTPAETTTVGDRNGARGGGALATGDVVSSRDGGAAYDRRWLSGRLNLLAGLSVITAIVPIAVATVRAVAGGWRAVADNAFFGLRAADVLTQHHPLLGTWTSVSVETGLDVNNPGPLLFDLLALPVRIGGPHAGLAVGAALVNVASILGIAAVARRQAGPRAVVAAMAAATALGWAMGSQLLFDPWQPHSLLYPFLCFLFMAWALACGDLVMLPWMVGVASLIVQTHVGYALLVPALALWAVVAAGTRLWHARQTDPGDRPAQRHRIQRLVLVSGVVALFCWSQPVVEQLFADGRGNLARLASSIGRTGDSIGVGDAFRYVAEVVALPPWWGRPSMSGAFTSDDAGPALGPSLIGLAAIVVLLAAAWRVGRRRGDSPAGTAALTGVVLVGVAVVAATTMPLGAFDLAAHQMRWLWPAAVFVIFALLLAVSTAGGQRFNTMFVYVVTITTAATCLINLPSMNVRANQVGFVDAIPTVRELLPQLSVLRGEEAVLVDVRGQRFAEPYTTPVLVELQRLDVPWFVDNPVLLRQVGASRANEGQATMRLFLREGVAALSVPEGTRRIALANGSSAQDAAELASIKRELRPFIAGGGVVLRPSGSSGWTRITEAELRDADHLFDSRTLAALVHDDGLELPERWAELAVRYADLQSRVDRLTVAVFVEPLGQGQ